MRYTANAKLTASVIMEIVGHQNKKGGTLLRQSNGKENGAANTDKHLKQVENIPVSNRLEDDITFLKLVFRQV